MYEEIKTINVSDEDQFTKEVNELLKKGWVILSTDIGFVNCVSYDFCTSCMAILGFPSASE